MGKAVKALTAVIVILVILTGLFYLVNDTNYLNGLNLPGRYQIPATVSTTFSRNFTFSSSSSTNESFSFYLTPPVNDQFQQSQLSVQHSSNIQEKATTDHNRTYINMTIYPGNSYADFNYNVTSYGQSWHYLENSTANLEDIPEYLKAQYDHPEWFNYSGKSYEVINPSEFKSLTLNITQNNSSVVGKLRAIYDYIVQHFRYNITYNIGNVPLTSQQVYQQGIGDCEELSYLFESMSRSIGIPSWTQYGLLVQSVNGQVTIAEHAWVQTYIPTSNTSGKLVNIDITVEVGGQDLGRGFLVKFPFSITEWTDNGNSTDMVDYHDLLTYPSYGLTINGPNEVDSVHSFSESGAIVVANGNLFNLLVANISKD